jgi:hypothetical protein
MAPSFLQAAVSLISVSTALAAADTPFAVALDKRVATVPTTLPGTWQYQGCYIDFGPRTLSGPSYTTKQAMSVESCINYCDSVGYIYAGTEWSQECCE